MRGFFELGMDSFSLSDFVKALERDFQIELGESAGIAHPTIDQITDHISTLIADLAPAVPVPEPGRPPDHAPAPAEPVRTADSVPVPVQATAAPLPAAEPIAIVGMACRLPGADGLAAFWRLLSDGVDASGDIPADRFDADAILATGPVTPGTIVTRRGSFLDRVDEFDNAFFRISAREARSMDPQQRLFLEVAWEALEDAGVRTTELQGSRVGLYVGLNTTDYMQTVTRNATDIDLYYGTGNSFSGTAGRMSYFLGVRGPSIAVDTACSSSLTAVHLACQALRAGEAQLAVAGGVNVVTNPTVYLAMSAAGALAPDGRCKTFAADADGYGRGEGAGSVVLKTLSRARADGDRVYAVLRGSAVNHNGASGGLTVPSGRAQEEVIADALDRAGIAPAEVGYVEAHGTGTRLGDGVELAALARALGPGRPPGRPVLIGSVKTNIGHLEAAAGIAGLIKTALALHHGAVPAQLHLREPSRQIDWAAVPIEVATRHRPWPAEAGRHRVAGVSAFGFTGTNAHVVLTEADPAAPPRAAAAVSRPLLLAASGSTEPALRAAARLLCSRLDGTRPGDIADICYTAGARRTHLEHRLVAVGRGGEDLRSALTAHAAGVAPSAAVDGDPGVHTGRAAPGEPRRSALVYGETVADLPWQAWDAGEPAFAAALADIDARTLDLLGRSARQALYDGAARRGDPVAVLAGQIALTALWRDHGLRPDAVVGAGRGEIAAAHAAGLLSTEQAVRAISGLRGVGLSGTPVTAVHLDSVSGGDWSQWTAPAALAQAPWKSQTASSIAAAGIDLVVDAGFDTSAADLADAATTDALAVIGDDCAHSGVQSPAHVVAELHVLGCPVDWTALTGGAGSVVSLPAYPWQRRRHWIGSADVAPAAAPDRIAPEIEPVVTALRDIDTTTPAVPPPGGDPEQSRPGSTRSAFAAELGALDPQLRPDRVLTPVLACLATALGESGGADVDPDLGFFEMGLDSVLAVASMNELGALVGLELEPTLTFEYPTPRALAGYLLDAVCAEPPAAPDPPDQPSPADRPYDADRAARPEPAAEPDAVTSRAEPDAAAPAAEPETDELGDLADLSDDDLMSRLLDRIASSEALLNEVGQP